MEYVYSLWHEVDIIEEPEKDEETLIGLYSTQEKAEEALSRFKKLERFSAYPDGFGVHRCKINRDDWTSGYAPVWY
ncbi:hypothetical protein [Candidatus Bodocaedibacter vickermanii]|uniref:DUF7336 domain-containing protein n=1 Tax=Candidatus Bodocaedibacter vickermanii TaxID=2741701 RepID=A0A7L9RT17_9PROT|nr:hypothetical protein CPBP_00525 [Candidatus Paracaedibacteraceae bacterium 'Lake Konstanz']